MQHIKIRIAWNLSTEVQRGKLIEPAVRMVTKVLEKDPIIKFVIVDRMERNSHKLKSKSNLS